MTGYIRKPHMRGNYNGAALKKQRYEADQRRELNGKTVHKLHTEYGPTKEKALVSSYAVMDFYSENGYYPKELRVPWTPSRSYIAVSLYQHDIKKIVGIDIKSHKGEFVEWH